VVGQVIVAVIEKLKELVAVQKLCAILNILDLRIIDGVKNPIVVNVLTI